MNLPYKSSRKFSLDVKDKTIQLDTDIGIQVKYVYTVEPHCLELEGTTRKYSSYPRFDLSEIDSDVSYFISKGSDVCFHDV